MLHVVFTVQVIMVREKGYEDIRVHNATLVTTSDEDNFSDYVNCRYG